MEKLYSERIKNLRIDIKLSQTELAQKIGATQKQISNWETGFIEPNISMLIKLARFFNVSVDYIVGNEDL